MFKPTKIQKATWQHKNATEKFDYTTIADQLRTVSWGYDYHPTDVVKPVNGIPTHQAGIILQLAEIWICFVSNENNCDKSF